MGGRFPPPLAIEPLPERVDHSLGKALSRTAGQFPCQPVGIRVLDIRRHVFHYRQISSFLPYREPGVRYWLGTGRSEPKYFLIFIQIGKNWLWFAVSVLGPGCSRTRRWVLLY